MSNFFLHGSVEEKRAIYFEVANAAILEQQGVICAARNSETGTKNPNDPPQALTSL